jgi:serine/threonine protein kinase
MSGSSPTRKASSKRRSSSRRRSSERRRAKPPLRIALARPEVDMNFGTDFDEDEAQYYRDKGNNRIHLYGNTGKLVKVAGAAYYNANSYRAIAQLFKKPADATEASKYISPILAQYVLRDQSAVQLMVKEGDDLINMSEYHRAKLLANRDKILSDLDAISAFLGRKRILHRDIKPDNIIWSDAEGRAKLIDVTNIITLPEGTNSMPNSSFKGTPYYVPAEARRANGRTTNFSHASNVYAIERTKADLLNLT